MTTNQAKKISIGIAVLLLLFQLSLQLYLAKTDSQTSDEAVHLSAGYSYLKYKDFRFNPEHPPLVKMLAALPLFALSVNDAPAVNGLRQRASNFLYDNWRENRQYGEDLLYRSGNDADKVLFWARVLPTLLTIGLGVTVYAISVYLFGWLAGLLSLGLYVFDPSVAAHGHLVTTDIAAAFGFVGTLFLLWLFLLRPSWLRALVFGVVLGLAFLTKFTTIILLPIILVILAWWHFSRQDKDFRLGKAIAMLAVGGLGAWFIIIAGYFFTITPMPKPDSIISAIDAANGYVSVVSTASRHLIDSGYKVIQPLLLPRDYFKGLDYVLTHTKTGHSAYLLGQYSRTGWWYYFPLVFLLKTSLIALVVIGLAIILSLRKKNQKAESSYWLLAAALYLIIAMTSRADLGVRHILPIYPMLYIATGSLMQIIENRYGYKLLFTTLVLGAFTILTTHPFYMSYFNPLGGGSWNGYKVVADSNVDWGQDLKRIKRYVENYSVDKYDLKKPYIVYSWAGDGALDYYGLERRPTQNLSLDKTGYIIISSAMLQTQEYRWVQSEQLVDKLTPSVFVYRLR